MHAPSDARLWAHVRRTVTPLGKPCPGSPRLPEPPVARRAIDLHGDGIHAAHGRVREAVLAARAVGRGELVVITGRSGTIRSEFPVWARLNPDVRSCEPLRGGGAFRIRL